MICLLFLIPVIFAQDNIANCPSNLVRSPALRAYNGHCYEFITHHHKDWSHARDDCTTKGGHLVTITSSAENQFIMASLNSLNFHANGAWIGLSDQRVEGKWEWVTGEPVNYTFWGVAQPGLLHKQEDCVLFEYSDSGKWHDSMCTSFLFILENYPWICEYKQTSFFVPTATPVPTTTSAPVITTTPVPVTTTTSAAVNVTVPSHIIG